MKSINKFIFAGLVFSIILFVTGCSPSTGSNPTSGNDNGNEINNQSKGPFTVECSELEAFFDKLEKTTRDAPYEIIVSHPVEGVLGPVLKANAYNKKFYKLSFINYEEDSSINYSAYTEMDSIRLNNSLISLVIPKTVEGTETDTYSFLYGCGNLETIEVEEGNPTFSSKNGVLYREDETTLVCYPKEKKDSEFTMPETVKYVYSGAFAHNDYITKVYINPAVQYLDGWIFPGCSALKEFKTDSTVSNKKFIDIDGVLFNDVYKKLISYPPNKEVKNYTVPDGIKTIDYYAFYECQKLEKVVISSQVTEINDCAFQYCDNLVSVVIPVSVTFIGEEAFTSCDSLTNIYYRGTQEEWNAIEKEENIFYFMDTPVITYNYSN